jgi:hypothetical protein
MLLARHRQKRMRRCSFVFRGQWRCGVGLRPHLEVGEEWALRGMLVVLLGK